MPKDKIIDKNKLVDINKVYPNPRNPNTMTDRMFKALVDDVDKNGLIGSILVREHPTKKGFEIVDGEHRWKAAKELGYSKVSIIELDLNDINAVFQMIRFNREKGYFDNLKLNDIVEELIDKTNRTMVKEKLFLNNTEFDKLLSGLNEEVSGMMDDVDDEDYGSLLKHGANAFDKEISEEEEAQDKMKSKFKQTIEKEGITNEVMDKDTQPDQCLAPKDHKCEFRK